MVEVEDQASKMVLREQTTLQVRSLVAEMEKPFENRLIQTEIFGNDNPPSLPSSRKKNVPIYGENKSCLANNLFHAVYKCRLKKIKYLLDNGFNINTKNDYGYNVLVAALHIENSTNRAKMFRCLLDRNADPFETDPKHNRDVLAWACLLGREEQVTLLLDTFIGEIDFYRKDNDGSTPLHLATIMGQTEIVRILVNEMIKYGTVVDVTDNLGLTPYLHAKRLGHGLIADILRTEGRASVGQSDLFSFKSAEQWREIGIKEKNEKARQKRLSEYHMAAINGNSRLLINMDKSEGFLVEAPTILLTGPSGHHKKHDTGPERKESIKTVRIMTPKSHVSLAQSEKSKRLRVQQDTDGTDPPVYGALSLIKLSPRGYIPKHFRHSQLDETKVAQYGHILSDLNLMMKYLSDEQTPSFRRPVPPPILKESLRKDTAQKKSTLAIIFGKGTKGKQSPTLSASGGKRKRREVGSGKSTKSKGSRTHK
ncbi:hypothetical protein CHS0354_034539 [Potamilus streckersoni]|uniref:Uncharacterized protein n=1 Tax=Potamilus streckersoni TaxID=2493646 RepID=A0AAE0VUB4_9BIVA|nr:hypothetical protein CHS0354_034539 [Potamilus streckersoni]